MRLHMEGKGTPIVPHLLGRVAEWLKQLNTPHADIFEARVTLGQQAGQYKAQVRLLLAGKTLHAMQHGASPDAAIGAALWGVAHALYKVRARRRSFGVSSPPRQNVWWAATATTARGHAERSTPGGLPLTPATTRH